MQRELSMVAFYLYVSGPPEGEQRDLGGRVQAHRRGDGAEAAIDVGKSRDPWPFDSAQGRPATSDL